MKPSAEQTLFVGVMTGTSIDGLDIAAIRVPPAASANIEFVAAADYPLPAELREQIMQLARNTTLDWPAFGQVDAALGELTGTLVNQFLADKNIPHSSVRAIGSHGQTVHHSPDSHPAFTVQLGDASRISYKTGLPVVSDFRRADVAAGGQGAPLVPAFHAALFGNTNTRTICNIGGIANITLLPADPNTPITGFDTGPGNTLLDAWINKHQNLPYDAAGDWAASGTTSTELLSVLMGDAYVQRPPPKSTGVEHYNLAWLDTQLARAQSQEQPGGVQPADIQATLLEFTARTIVNSVRASQPDCQELIVCGGGRRNTRLMDELARLGKWPVVNCDTVAIGNTEKSIDGDALEAAAFAWLASQNLAGLPGNVPTVTGASKAVLLGTLTQPI